MTTAEFDCAKCGHVLYEPFARGRTALRCFKENSCGMFGRVVKILRAGEMLASADTTAPVSCPKRPPPIMRVEEIRMSLAKGETCAAAPRYETCMRCGKKWNVSRDRSGGPYICPHCVHTEKEERNERKNV